MFERFDTRSTAIDGDQQGRAIGGQAADGIVVGAVALEDAIGNMDGVVAAAVAQEVGEQGGRARAVNVIVAEDRDAFACRDGLCQSRDGRLHIHHGGWIGHGVAHGRMQEGQRRFRRHATAGENTGENVADAELLHQGFRYGTPVRPQTITPGHARHRAFDIEECGPNRRVQHGRMVACRKTSSDSSPASEPQLSHAKCTQSGVFGRETALDQVKIRSSRSQRSGGLRPFCGAGGCGAATGSAACWAGG